MSRCWVARAEAVCRKASPPRRTPFLGEQRAREIAAGFQHSQARLNQVVIRAARPAYYV